MPTQQVIRRKEKAVLVRVYVEKPRKKKVPSNHLHHHHHHHHHHIVHHHGPIRKGYDRKAELLRYSQFLRDTAQKAPSTPLSSQRLSNNINGKPTTRFVPSQRKQMNEGKLHGCFGNWKLLIPSFLRSRTSAKPKERKKKQMHSGLSVNQMTNVKEKLGVKTRKGFFPRVFSSTRKHS